MHALFRALQPYAQSAAIDQRTFFGGLYQRLILTR